MPDMDLLARACETNAAYLALGNERFEACGATFVRNHETPRRNDANCVGLVRTVGTAEVAALIARVEEEYSAVGRVRLDLDPLTPPETGAAISLADFRGRDGVLVLVLEGELQATPRPIDVREVLTEDDWRAYRGLYVADLDEYDARLGEALGSQEPGLMDEFMAYKRNKTPAARAWLAYDEDVPASYLTSWPGDNGVGIVEDLFTLVEHRHRGLATALLAHCVADARSLGAGPVIINADPNDTPKQMYAAMGFRPFFLARGFWRELH